MQAKLFSTCALCNGQTWSGGKGRLVITTIDDGRALIRLEDGTTRGNWLELLPNDVAWVIHILTHGFTKVMASDGQGE